MKLFICFLALAALSSAQQLQNGPQVLSEKSSEQSQKIDKRFVTQEFNLYLTPEEIKALQAVKSSQKSVPIDTLNKNPGINQESINELLQKFYAENLKPAPIEEPQVEQAPPSSRFFIPTEESVYNKQNLNSDTYRQLLIDQTKLSGQAQNVRKNKFNQLPSLTITDSSLVRNNPVVDKDQEEKLLHKQLNQQWTRILDHNRAQLKGLSSTPENTLRTQQNFRGFTDQAPSTFSKPAPESNRNEDQKKSVEEKEIEYIFRNGQIYESKPLGSPSPVQVRNQNPGRNEGEKKSAVEKEIENVWRQHQAFEFERSNSPAEVNKENLPAKNENQEKKEGQKPINYIIRNGQIYELQRSQAIEVNAQGSQGRNEGQKVSEVEREIEKFWTKQPDSPFPRQYVPVGVINQGPSGKNENRGKSSVDKQIENILRQKALEFERSKLSADINQSPSGRNENKEKSTVEKQIESILKRHKAKLEKENAPAVKNQSPSLTTVQNKSVVDKEIQNILKQHQDYELQRSKSTADAISKSPPVLIHKHVTITKHLPVAVVKNVQVSVPTPVLVPIPQPYEVKVPHLYPVPLEVVKHVPVPVVSHY